MLNAGELAGQLRDLGLRPGMDLLVHSSLRRLGPVAGGADAVIDVLLEALGPEGTLVMSTVSNKVTPEQPLFHVTHTPSSVGALSNVFRARPGTVRSLHPVHSVAACGPRAGWYTRGHHRAATPWSPETPYGRLMRAGGHLLLLGTDFAANSCLHALEIEARVPGLHTAGSTTLQVIDAAGRFHAVEHHWHEAKRCFYQDLEHLVEKAGGLRYGRTGAGISRLVAAARMREVLLPVFRETPELAVMRLTDSRFVWA